VRLRVKKASQELEKTVRAVDEEGGGGPRLHGQPLRLTVREITDEDIDSLLQRIVPHDVHQLRRVGRVNCKIVYYGPGLCGKTTNLQWIYDKTNPQAKAS